MFLDRINSLYTLLFQQPFKGYTNTNSSLNDNGYLNDNCFIIRF